MKVLDLLILENIVKKVLSIELKTETQNFAHFLRLAIVRMDKNWLQIYKSD